MKTRKYKNGFTLIEMLVVVAVIAILATMVIGVATHIDTQAKEKGLESVFSLLEGALQEYHEFTGGFPVHSPASRLRERSINLYQDLHSIPNSRKILEKINDSLIENKYGTAQTPVICDPWGTVLDYRYIPGQDSFPPIISAGPDRNFNTADDISNR